MNRRSKIFISIFLLTSIVVLTSCFEEREYEFIVTNNTTYRVDKMTISDTELSIDPNSTLAPVTITYKKGVGHFFTEPLVGMSVRTYSDSTTTYENTYGRVVSLSDLKEILPNIVTLELDPAPFYPTDVFIVKVN